MTAWGPAISQAANGFSLYHLDRRREGRGGDASAKQRAVVGSSSSAEPLARQDWSVSPIRRAGQRELEQ